MIIKHDARFMNLAFTVALSSKCKRAKYGSVIIDWAGHLVGSGYNGKPAGSINDDICYREGLPPSATIKPNCCLHSEANCLLFTPMHYRNQGTMYVSGIPCQDCTLLVMQSNIRRLVYYDQNNRDDDRILLRYCSAAFEVLGSHTTPTDQDSLWRQYGIDMERVPFTFLSWAKQFGP